MQNGKTWSGMFASVAFAALATAACSTGPQYPNCQNDALCQRDGRRGVCVRGSCEQCRQNSDCTAGWTCDAQNRCAAPVIARAECDSDNACASGNRCQLGHCMPSSDVSATPEGGEGHCTFAVVHFAFDQAILDAPSRHALQSTADCLQRERTTRYVLVGRADPRGTTEYNFALGERRAEAVQHYLVALGVADDRLAVSSMGSEGATGATESEWANDRRVEPNHRDAVSHGAHSTAAN